MVRTDFIYQLIYVQRICVRVPMEVALPVKIVRQMGPAFVKVAKADIIYRVNFVPSTAVNITHPVIYALQTSARVRMVMLQWAPIVPFTTRRSVLRVATDFTYPIILVF